MKLLIQRIRTNLFLSLIILCYALLLLLQPNLGVQGIKNSGYYIKEMLLIMPVVFVLTALLDTWIPQETIIKLLGKEAKAKGVLLSFLLGSVSAGPVYAAFPFCKMLYKKGASINNMVIILSAWAVIKIPMLINEAKFLGPRFMATRWFFTVLAILMLAWLTAKIVHAEDLPTELEDTTASFAIDTKSCIGCGICAKAYPDCFQVVNKKAVLLAIDSPDLDLLQATASACPFHAITQQ